MSQTLYMEEQLTPQQDHDFHQDTEQFLKQLESLPTPEEKLKECISFMQEALAQPASPNFKGFWDVRKICLPLFKEPLSPQVRTQFWGEYIELTREGRRLKTILDEESDFAVEQIDLAIKALENEIQGYQTHLNEILEKTAEIEFPQKIHSLEHRYAFYQKLQKQLVLLNFYASRINALRKELIRTDMRIRQKNKFFQRLSLLGDQVFPTRKQSIGEISEAFVTDVEAFVQEYFSDAQFNEAEMRRSVFFFREEIKNLQTMAKILTLNTHAFSTTREMLSQCWDRLKGMEKELKKEYIEQKQKSTENAAQVQERIEAFIKAYGEQALSYEEGLQELEAISQWMRGIQLTRTDVRRLRDLLQSAKQPLDSKKDEEANFRRQKEAEFEKARQERVEAFKNQVLTLQAKLLNSPLETLSQELEEARKTLPSLPLSKTEKQHLERNLKTLRDQIAEKQSQALLTLSDDDRAALNDLERMLTQLADRRKEIKLQIEEYRKIIGGSGLDFEKAMRYNELMEAEKERLAKIDENMAEIKKKMRLLKSS
jgi:DNA repair exonuclease SbcCD ATPase subunit